MIDVGSKIRKLRKSKNLSIADLSAMTGLSTGLISQIERNKVVPTIVAMLKIVNALEVTMGYFFDEEKDMPTIIRKDERRVFATNDDSRIYEFLTPTHNKKMEFILIRLNNCTHKSEEAFSHVGEECGYVIKGSMAVIIGGKRYVLNEGDSIYFDSSIPHVYESNDDNECISIWAMTPPSW
ncbi:helix-turn-helix domain-containing protein [Lutispora thermophila]|uniref:Transcriptional regulator, contains XRE-family HTH domain n=1 Tax=Lutispora thermophila DSM 19022 TaxID=1122184 RepID=A0A1M6BQN3_9FIRM|nr:XRE family transcriptional regulator [Lutispora thermophila]SHI51027.1 Transcriptional regulator, contains XRE-family HTH domain [Lutispora thermophila DSM 19022]